MRFLAAALIVLAGCATSPPVDTGAARGSWQGASYDEVVGSWGVPARSTQLSDGRDAHTWVSESVESRGVVWPSIGIFGGSGGVSIGTGVTIGQGASETIRCERTLIFRSGRVVDQTWLGPADYCNTFRRGQG